MTKTAKFTLSVAVLVLVISGIREAQAGIVMTMTESGNNVVMSGGGTINLADLELFDTLSLSTGIEPRLALLSAGSTTGVSANEYSSLDGPKNFGTGNFLNASSGTGDRFGIIIAGNLKLIVPTGYDSGTLLSATDTFANQTFSSLGVTEGTYVWTWGSGANADSFTLNVISASVPEPSSLVLCGVAVLTGIGYSRIRRKAA